MFKLRYYCKGKGNKEIVSLLVEIEKKQGIKYEIFDLSRNGEYDIEKEKQVYERDFKPRAKILKKRIGIPITKLRARGGAGRYYVSLPGTIAVINNGIVEWWTLEDSEIVKFLKTVLLNGTTFLEKCSE